MVFTSMHYLVFLPLVVAAYYTFPNSFRWAILLIASLYFYACWSVWILPCLLVVIFVSYIVGLLVAADNKSLIHTVKRKYVLICGGFVLIGILLFFKYLNFFIDQMEIISFIIGKPQVYPRVRFITPVGISFFVFQSLGYVIDVYQGKAKPETHIGKYALFIAFFPHIAQGPIDRSNNLLLQINGEHPFDYVKVRNSLVLILWGVFKKIVVADRLAIFVDTVFDNVANYSGLVCWIAAFFYSFQIYCDFSGYTDIALGSAKLMGFNLMENFNAPYLATSIADFWRRWHISLSSWFRDYLYIPLGGNRVSGIRWAVNIFVVFLISGIWHGAAWTFILWGCLHGAFQIIGKMKRKYINNQTIVLKIFNVLVTFILVTLLWALFRSTSISNWLTILVRMFSISPGMDLSAVVNNNELVLSFILIGIIALFDITNTKISIINAVEELVLPIRWLIYLTVLFTIIMFGRYGSLTSDSFIYFRF